MLKISELVAESDTCRIGIEFKIDRKEDAFMAQEILRALAYEKGNYIYFGFGYDKNYEEKLEFEYKCDGYVNILLYYGDGRIRHKSFLE